MKNKVYLCNRISMIVNLVLTELIFLALTFSRPYMNEGRKSGYCVDSTVMFEAVVPDHNKCVLCNTMQQDHK